jgi:hypothetical protein
MLVQCIAVNIMYLLAMLKEGTGDAFLWLADKGHTNKHVVHCMLKFFKLSEPIGSD